MLRNFQNYNSNSIVLWPGNNEKMSMEKIGSTTLKEGQMIRKVLSKAVTDNFTGDFDIKFILKLFSYK